MTDRILIVARLEEGSADEVARLFAASDRTDLPRALGVTRRDLFQYQGLYFHSAEFDGSAREAMTTARERQDFRHLSEELSSFVTPYDPSTWRSPADAMARAFYTWTPDRVRGSR